jgi:hypothetical protein
VNWPPILLSGLLGVLGTLVGALLGPYFSKTWQRESGKTGLAKSVTRAKSRRIQRRSPVKI